MKLLILITKSNWGGAQRYVYDIATNLDKSKFDTEVLAGGNGVLIEKLNLAGVKASGDLPIGRDVKILEDIKAFIKLVKIIKDKKPDILHVNSSKIGGLGALAGRIAGVKRIVFTAHGWAFNENRSFFSKLLIKISYWIILALSDITIAVSDATKNQIENWPYVYKKIVTVHNGIRPESYYSKIHAKAELAKINPNFAQLMSSKSQKETIIVGSIGELHHIKGFDYSIQAIHELTKHTDKRVIYAIIGAGEERASLEAKIKELGLEASVILFGNVPQAYQYLKAFDIFVISSLSEGFPYIALEAGLYGLPIIATAVGGIPEIVDDMKSGILIQPRKFREIQYAIEFYVHHKKVQKEHSTAIRDKVMGDFSIEKMIEETVKVYE